MQLEYLNRHNKFKSVLGEPWHRKLKNTIIKQECGLRREHREVSTGAIFEWENFTKYYSVNAPTVSMITRLTRDSGWFRKYADCFFSPDQHALIIFVREIPAHIEPTTNRRIANLPLL